MYKLYGNIAYSWKKLDLSVDEKDIVDTMIICHNKFKLYDYLIINRENNTDMIYKRIRSEEEYIEYINEYKERIKPLEDMSCMNLKKYIIKKKDNKNGSK